MAWGENFRLRHSVPNFLGILCGVIVLLLLVGLGLARLFEAYPIR